MKQAFKKSGNGYIREVPALKPGLGQIRLRVEACGVCGTDIHENPDELDQESAFGHEVAGEILEVGDGVDWLEPGTKVVLDSATPCGRCRQCRNARQELCEDIQSFWFIPSFGFAEEMLAPAICAIPYQGMTPEVACLQEPFGVAIDLVRLADIGPDNNVLIMGQGPIGLMATALARQAGARRIFVSELKTKVRRTEMAGQFGADLCLDPMESPLEEFDFGCSIDRILSTAPPKTLNTAFTVAAKGAIVSFIGIEHGHGGMVEFDANAFHFKKLQLRASFASPALFGPRALRYLNDGIVDGEAMVSHRFPLDRIDEALKTAANDPEAVKVVIC